MSTYLLYDIITTIHPNIWLNSGYRELRREFGDKCQLSDCKQMIGLEFKKIKNNDKKLNRKEKYYDIIKNREDYVLLCHKHFSKDGSRGR